MSQIEYEFVGSLAEVNELLTLAEEASNTGQAVVTALNKAALILLAAKFENFLENLVESYVFFINQSNFPRNNLPIQIRYNHFRDKLTPLIKDNSLSMEKTDNLCREIAEFFSNQGAEINISSKFNYGKHGSNEIERLMRRIGVQDIFCCFMPIDKTETVEIDIAADIDSMTYIRNNIIHGDADPALSTEQIRGYIFKLDLWANCLVDILNHELNFILS